MTAIYGQDFLNASENPLSDTTGYGNLDDAGILQIISDTYAEGAGSWENDFLLRSPIAEPVDGNSDGVAEITSQLTGVVTSFVDDAGERFLTLSADGTPQTLEEEIAQLVQVGVDGLFTDFSGIGAEVIDTITADFVYSPDNLTVLAGEVIANLAGSRGFEGIAFSPNRQTLYPILEGTVLGDPAGSLLRIYEFDMVDSEFGGLLGYYQLDTPNHAIGDFTPIYKNEFLVVERDGSTTFDFPFVTIEDVLVLDEDTLLVANDNNYPFFQGRDAEAIDNNEIIKIQLDRLLALGSLLDVAGFNGSTPPDDGDNSASLNDLTGGGTGELIDSLLQGGLDNGLSASYEWGNLALSRSDSGSDALRFDVDLDPSSLASSLGLGSLSLPAQAENTLLSAGSEVLADILGTSSLTENLSVTI